MNEKKNSGDWNSGNGNSGNGNSGHKNSGDWNSGDENSGHRNSGDWNSGDWNSGERNSGHRNSGHKNSGHKNSGHRNSGHRNSGHGNSGHWNSGHWNSGDWNSGFFNTDEPRLRMFNKDTNLKRDDVFFPRYFYFNLTEWIDEEDMTEQEKEDNPEYETTKGYLKMYDYKEAWKKSFKESCDMEQAEKTINLPNFDYDIFEEITGITKEMLDNKRSIKDKYLKIKLEKLSKENLISIIRKLKEE